GDLAPATTQRCGAPRASSCARHLGRALVSAGVERKTTARRQGAAGDRAWLHALPAAYLAGAVRCPEEDLGTLAEGGGGGRGGAARAGQGAARALARSSELTRSRRVAASSISSRSCFAVSGNGSSSASLALTQAAESSLCGVGKRPPCCSITRS